MKKLKLFPILLIVLIALFLSINGASAGYDTYEMRFIVPTNITITTTWNNVTGSSLLISIDTNATVGFGATTDLKADNISWFNGSTFLHNDSLTYQGNLTHTFTIEGVYLINVSAVNSSFGSTGNTTFTVTVSTPSTIYVVDGTVKVITQALNQYPISEARVYAYNGTTLSGSVLTTNVGYYIFSTTIQNVTIVASKYGYYSNSTLLNLTGDTTYNILVEANLLEPKVPVDMPGFNSNIFIISGMLVLFYMRRQRFRL